MSLVRVSKRRVKRIRRGGGAGVIIGLAAAAVVLEGEEHPDWVDGAEENDPACVVVHIIAEEVHGEDVSYLKDSSRFCPYRRLLEINDGFRDGNDVDFIKGC